MTVLHRGRHTGALPASVRRLTGDRDRLAEHAVEFRSRPPEGVLDMIAGDERQARAVVEAFRGIARRRTRAGWSGRIVTLSRDRTPPHRLPRFHTGQPWTADSSRIRNELGYRESVTREEALRRTVAWERAHPAACDATAFDYEAQDRAPG